MASRADRALLVDSDKRSRVVRRCFTRPVIIVIGAAVFLVGLVVGGFFLFKIAASLSTKERIALGVVVVLALLYFVPGMIHAGISAHRKALEIRASQGR